MVRRFVSIAMAVAITTLCAAQEKEKIKLKFTGRAEAYVFTDTYKSIETGGGIQYLMPARPNIDPITGDDLNREGSLRFGISSTRLGVKADYKISPRFAAGAVVEADFMGAGGANPINIIRLRHAYMNLAWQGGSSLIVGQTSHLQAVDQMAPPTVLFGAGYPLNPLSRPIQIRYTYDGIRMLNIAVAASMFSGSQGAMQSAAMFPDLSARVMLGDLSTGIVGLCGGMKTLRPKIEEASPKENLYTWNASAFGMFKFAHRWTARAYIIAGQDLQSFGMVGAVAPTITLDAYSASTTLSYWLDLEVNLNKGFSLGIFAGSQHNLGFANGVDLAKLSTSADLKGIDSFYRIAPRLWYGIGNLQFGFEYLFTQAKWSKELNVNYLPVDLLPIATNHRFMLMARYNF